jgi:hypothetical protein
MITDRGGRFYSCSRSRSPTQDILVHQFQVSYLVFVGDLALLIDLTVTKSNI